MKLYTGCVENRMDPLRLGRCQVRIVGLHTEQKSVLPTEDLPWAYPLQPVTSAAMNGIGHTPVGPVEGTWVVIFFRDEDEQQPIMLGTIGGIPQSESKKIDEFTDFIEMYPSSVTSGSKSNNNSGESTQNVVTDNKGDTYTTSSGQTAANSTASNTAVTNSIAIPGVAPYSTRSWAPTVKIPSSSTRGIQALGAAMDTAGITGRYARAAILGIAMGESKCIPQLEGYKYNSNRLKQIYSWIEEPQLTQYSNWGGTREDFFRYIYGPTTRSGKALGNTSADDGAMYYGRGYIQLTGRPNYVKYAKLSDIDIVNYPNLCNDYDKGALVTVWYFKDRVKVAQNDPGYFEAACRAVGYNAPDIYATKKAHYEYFLGEAAPGGESSGAEKSAESGKQPANVEVNDQGIPVDRAQNMTTGFSDPEMKYPLRSHIGEPDTNRLARSKVPGTAVEKKDNSRAQGMPKADGSTFNQPPVPYNAKYPFNHVFESESGHLQEFDDTAGNERVHIYHKSGTFTEVDVNGTQVNRIVGDGYQIIDKNGFVYIKGACTITAEGTTNIFVNANAKIKVSGITDIDLLNDANLNVAGDFNVNVGGNYNVKSGSAFNMESGAAMNMKVSGNINADGSKIMLNSGASSGTGLGSAPSSGSPANNNFDILNPPARNIEDNSSFETPEDSETAEGKTYQDQADSQIVGDKSTPQNTESTESNIPSKTTIIPVQSTCEAIYGMNTFPASFKLSANTTIGKLRGGPEHIIQDQCGLSKQEIVCNLKGLAEHCVEPIMEAAGGPNNIIITSGYRLLGAVSYASPTSQHPKGQAFDFQLVGKINDYQATYDFINKLASIIPYDQLILEYRDPGTSGNNRNIRVCWIHCSFAYTGSRRQAFTMLNDKTYKRDSKGNPAGFYLLT